VVPMALTQLSEFLENAPTPCSLVSVGGLSMLAYLYSKMLRQEGCYVT
jgi:hypothetical protein